MHPPSASHLALSAFVSVSVRPSAESVAALASTTAQPSSVATTSAIRNLKSGVMVRLPNLVEQVVVFVVEVAEVVLGARLAAEAVALAHLLHVVQVRADAAGALGVRAEGDAD